MQRREIDGRSKKSKRTEIGPRAMKVINWELIKKHLKIQCTNEEICEVLDIKEDTLNAACKDVYGMTFAEWSEGKRKRGHKSLRRRMWHIAMSDKSKDSASMCKHLSRHYLKMWNIPEEAEDNRKPFIIRARNETIEIGVRKNDDKEEETL